MLQAHPSGRAVKGDLSLVGIAGLNPAGKWMCELITRSDESYRMWCVWVWSWILDDGRPFPTGGYCAV